MPVVDRKGTDRALWTIVNWSPEPAAGEILRVEHVAGTRYFDVWNGIEIEPTVHDGQATLKISAIEGHGLAAIVALKTAPDAAFEKLLADCRTRAARKLADYSDEWQPPAPPVLHLPGKTALREPMIRRRTWRSFPLRNDSRWR